MNAPDKCIAFSTAQITRLGGVKQDSIAKFSCVLPNEVCAALGWREPDELDCVVQKTTRLHGTRLTMKQSREEIGDHEADMEIYAVERFCVYRRASTKKPGTFVNRVQFTVRSRAIDFLANLEPLFKLTLKPCSLKIYYGAEKRPEPVQPNLEGVEQEETVDA